MLVNRNKRLFNNILRQLQNSRAKGIVTNEEVEQYKSNYNEIVIESAKKEFMIHKNIIKEEKQIYERI